MEQSFGKQVIHRAWFAAWQFFESKTRDAVLFIVLFVAGGSAYYLLFGWPAAKEQIVLVLTFTVGPIVGVWVLLFIWHLWLAPSAFVYEAARAAARPRQMPPQATPDEAPVNWSIWKQRQRFKIYELAAILAKDDPIKGAESSNQLAIRDLILEATKGRKLEYVPRYRAASGNRYELPIDNETSIDKPVAIAWAIAHGLDVTHIQ